MSYIENELYIYIIANEGWGENLYQFGYIRVNGYSNYESEREPLYYLRKIHKDYPYPFKYIKLYKLRMNKYYRLSLNRQILSDIAIEFITVEDIEKIYNRELPLLRQIKNFIIDNGSGHNFINQEGIRIIDRIIRKEFPILQMNIIKNYSQEEIDTINRNYKPYRRKQTNVKCHDIQNLISSYHNVSNEIIEKALLNYEDFHSLDVGVATIRDLTNSSAGIRGWNQPSDVIDRALANYEDFHSLDPGVVTVTDLHNSSAGISGWSIPFRVEDSDISGTNEIETGTNLQMNIQTC